MFFVAASDEDDDDAILLSGMLSMLEIVPDDTERAIGESSSWRPKSFSNSVTEFTVRIFSLEFCGILFLPFGSFANGRSCLLARINSGVPLKGDKKDHV